MHMLRHEIRGEKKYKLETTGADELKDLEDLGVDISHATVYMPASYDMLEDFISRSKSNHFVDIGCGKGRALCVAAHLGIQKLTGIDFNKKLCEEASKNLQRTKIYCPSIEYKIINNDAFYFEIPNDADGIFLFNPFDEMIMSGVIKNIQRSIKLNPRTIHITYLNPVHKHLFLNAGFIEIYQSRKLKFLEGCILKSPD